MDVQVTLREEIFVVNVNKNYVYKAKGLIGKFEPNGLLAISQVIRADGSLSDGFKPHAQIRLQYNDPNILAVQNLLLSEPDQT
jgi:hypothetical protein